MSTPFKMRGMDFGNSPLHQDKKKKVDADNQRDVKSSQKELERLSRMIGSVNDQMSDLSDQLHHKDINKDSYNNRMVGLRSQEKRILARIKQLQGN